MRSWRNAQFPGSTDIVVYSLETEIIVEHLDPAVTAVSYVDIPFDVYCKRVRQIELPRL